MNRDGDVMEVVVCPVAFENPGCPHELDGVPVILKTEGAWRGEISVIQRMILCKMRSMGLPGQTAWQCGHVRAVEPAA